MIAEVNLDTTNVNPVSGNVHMFAVCIMHCTLCSSFFSCVNSFVCLCVAVEGESDSIINTYLVVALLCLFLKAYVYTVLVKIKKLKPALPGRLKTWRTCAAFLAPCAPHFDTIPERAPSCKASQYKGCGTFLVKMWCAWQKTQHIWQRALQ